jgi:hypothetical protein
VTIFIEKYHIYRKFHTNGVNPLAGRKPQRFFRPEVGSFQQPDEPGEKIVRLANLRGEPGFLG